MRLLFLYLTLLTSTLRAQETFTGYAYKTPVLVYLTVIDSQMHITLLDTATQSYIGFQNPHQFAMNGEDGKMEGGLFCTDSIGRHIIKVPKKVFTGITVYEEEPGTAYSHGCILDTNIFSIAYEVMFTKEEKERIKQFYAKRK